MSVPAPARTAPEVGPPRPITERRVVQRRAQATIGAGQTIQRRCGIGSENPVASGHVTGETRHLPSGATPELPRAGQPRPSIQRCRPARHRRLTEQRMGSPQHLLDLRDQRTHRHTSSIEPPQRSPRTIFSAPRESTTQRSALVVIAVREAGVCRRHWLSDGSGILPTCMPSGSTRNDRYPLRYRTSLRAGRTMTASQETALSRRWPSLSAMSYLLSRHPAIPRRQDPRRGSCRCRLMPDSRGRGALRPRGRNFALTAHLGAPPFRPSRRPAGNGVDGRRSDQAGSWANRAPEATWDALQIGLRPAESRAG